MLPAAVLAIVVLTVFDKLQNYGPESAVRRFHEALITRNEPELEDVLYDPGSTDALNDIIARIYPLLADGAPIHLSDIDRKPSTVLVLVAYYPPDAQAASYDWVATKTPSGWKVNAAATTRLWAPIFGQ